MTSITGTLDLRHGDRGLWTDWTLLAPLTATTDDGTIVVPAGFVTDGASIPRLLWAILSPTGRWMRAAVVHDYLCDLIADGTPDTLAPDRRDADRIFHALMRSDGTNRITAWLMWAAVRLAGIFGRQG